MKTPRDYSAKGDGYDDAIPLQKWADAIAGKSGTLDRWYYTSKTVRPHPGTTVYGRGRDGSGIAAHPALPLANTLLMHAQAGCRFFDLGLRGSPALREAPGTTMVSFTGDDVLFHGCGFSWWRTLLAPAQTLRAQITSCDFGHWADSKTLPERTSLEGKAIIAANLALPVGERKPEWELRLRGHCLDDGGYALLGGNEAWPNDDLTVADSNLHDGNWTAIDVLHNKRCKIINTTIGRVKEAGLYIGGDTLVDRVTVLDVGVRDCSAHAIEGGGLGTRVVRGTFGRSGFALLMLTNPIGMYVGHNTLFDPMEEERPDSLPTVWSAAVMARNTDPITTRLGGGLMFEHNEFANNTGKAQHLLFMWDQGGGPFHNVTLGPNRITGKWRGEMLCCDPTAMGKNFVVHDHIGHV